jgi:hypothetical protein
MPRLGPRDTLMTPLSEGLAELERRIATGLVA